ncbi:MULTISPECIES: hypothetical protein [unclassified Microcystis]|uniref:hypothetical protein n=1 Tax=unclassified Microcystis TaxID=2643300 RepID=UPI0022BD3A31|nr:MULTISPECIES: hypothetical protein [unclassified Microcystis]MCZ8028278.1 hypothetical protein [Microcystis sp. LE19-10.1B]MCZ8362126.1 hypothetical protein [Microcystis sp. LE19-251.1A]MDJ0606237.1 hypothetical protein [Microcystis sp. M53602_WE12]
MKMGKTPHPTPHTLHPAPRKNFFSRPYLVLCIEKLRIVNPSFARKIKCDIVTTRP